MKRINQLVFILSFTAFLSSCGGGNQSENQSETLEATTPMEAATTEIADSVSLSIEGNDAMKFNKAEMTVTTGQIVTLTLKHVGNLPKASMGHNWVLLKPGTDLAEFGVSATTAVDTEYIPQDKLDQVIVHTKVIGGGEQTSITFKAPKPGYYTFICSFPGHWSAMQGSFVVSPA